MLNYLAHSYFTMVFKHWKMRYVPTCVSSDCTVLQQHYDEKITSKWLKPKTSLTSFWEGGRHCYDYQMQKIILVDILWSDGKHDIIPHGPCTPTRIHSSVVLKSKLHFLHKNDGEILFFPILGSLFRDGANLAMLASQANLSSI
jgi:hypothetical protein